MDAQELRALQAPLKEKYKADPESARVPARAEGVIMPDAVAVELPSFAGTTRAGLHPAGGGDGSEACSADMLMEALVGCAGVTLKAVATAMSVPFTSAKVIAEGHWDARGTLGVDRDAPVGLTDVKLTFEIDSPAEPEKLEKLVQLAERFCVIYQTLSNPPRLSSELKTGG
jgi:uncharacterized OsmC-like protein